MAATPPEPQGGLSESRHGPVAVLELCRARRANAYDSAMLTAFDTALDRLEAASEVRVVVLIGAGERAFCAGADLEEIAGRRGEDALALRSAALFRRLEAYPKVCLAAINGAAVAGGLELALACDLRIAVETAHFALPEPGIGLIPAAGGTRRLAEIVGQGRAKEMILGGIEWSAEEARRYGLVSEVVAPGALRDRALAWGASIAKRDALAQALAKRVMAQAGGAADELAAFAEALLYEIRSNR